MAEHNKKIASQLQSVSRAFVTMNDDELMSVLLDTCSALLDEVEQRRPAVADMDSMERSEYTIGYKMISDMVGRYARELQEAEGFGNSAEDPADAMAELERMREQVSTAAARNQDLKAELEKNRAELKSLQEFQRSMMEIGETCTPEIIEAQKKVNRKLLTEIGTRQNALEELRSKKAQNSETLRGINEKIQLVEEEINRIPEVHKELVEIYDAKCAELKRMQQAQELCGADKQAEIEAQILELKPVVEKMEQQMNTLSSQLQNFRNSRTELDRENQILCTDLLSCLNRAMGDLGLALEEHRQTLEEIRRQADTYRSSLEECENIRSGLVQWIGSDRRQFEASLAAIDRREYTNLQQTLNISAQKQVRDALDQAQAALEQVDGFLMQCAQAAQKDQMIVKRKAAVR